MNSDDPLLTAYALDELDPEEKAAFEERLRGDFAALAEIEATRAIASSLRLKLQEQPAEPLDEVQRARVFDAACRRERVVNCSVPFWKRTVILSTAAACLVVGISARLLWPTVSAPWKTTPPIQTHARHPEPEFHFTLNPVPSDYMPESPFPVISNSGLELAPVEINAPLLVLAPAPFVEPIELPERGIPMMKESPSASDSGRQQLADVKKMADLKKLLLEAEGFYSSARYGMASKRAENVLKIDPYNIAAHKLQEKIAIAKNSYASSAYNEARSRAAWKVSAAWSNPVSHLANASLAELKPMPGEADATAMRGRSGRIAQSFGAGAHYGASHSRNIEEPESADSYDVINDNAFLRVANEPLSTFSIDVDSASYANVRRFLIAGQLPPKDAVRIEELLNYFHYDYPPPADRDTPFASSMEVAACPWAPEHRLLRIALKGREIQRTARPPSNLVFLIDVSGSMEPEDRLPLLKRSMQLLVDQLGERDRVGIVVYAGASGCVLEPTSDKRKIRDALDELHSGGSTNGGAGIELAYDLAQKQFIKGGTNRVLLATDGDFNVGVTSQKELVKIVEAKAKNGIALTVLGFGTGNLKDSTLEKLADKGDGNYACIDTLSEGRRVLVEQMSGTLVTIAKDVKIQVEFNPAQVGAYRLIGYENRLLRAQDFNDDAKDAGEIGAGHSVTALYEIVPPGKAITINPAVDPLKYQTVEEKSATLEPANAKVSPEMLTLKLRFKAPEGGESLMRKIVLTDHGETWEKSSREFRFAAAVASFGMLLRDSPHHGTATWDSTLELANEGKGADADGYRAEFIGLVERARNLGK